MDLKDKMIFVTGIVGRAMGSGKYTGADIQGLTDLACQAWENSFGKFAEPAPAPAPAAPQMVAIPQPSLPEGKPFEMWKKDKCMHWNAGVRESTWEWLCEQAKAGGLQAKTTLKELANSDPGDPTAKYYKSNIRRAERAKAVLLMVG